MEVYKCVRSRLTVRRFTPDPVPDSVVDKLLRSARWAPSSENKQPWHFIVIKDREILAAIGGIAASGAFIAEAPLAIAVVMENAERPDLDAGRALQQIELVAWSEGLGTCLVTVGLPEENRRVKDVLEVPPDMDLVAVLPFGYRLEKVKGWGKRRKPLSQIAHAERFGRTYRTA